MRARIGFLLLFAMIGAAPGCVSGEQRPEDARLIEALSAQCKTAGETVAALEADLAALHGDLEAMRTQERMSATTTASGVMAVPGNSQPGCKDVLWVVDMKSDTPRLCVYQVDNGRLALIAARNIRYDFQMDQYPTNPGSQDPSVKQAYEATEGARRRQGH